MTEPWRSEVTWGEFKRGEFSAEEYSRREFAPLHDYSSSQAVLVGTWNYVHLPSLPAAENSLMRMTRLLKGPLCGWPPERISIVRNEQAPGSLADWLITEFERSSGVALFYYVGHGQIDMDDQLCLSLAGSRREANRRASTSIPFQAVRRALLDSPARTKIIILDCCFAGLANRPTNTMAAATHEVLDMAAGTGAYTMAATSSYTTAWYERASATAKPETFFTKYLADVIERGIPGMPAELSVHQLFTQLREELARDNRPIPDARAVDSARDFTFAYNASADYSEGASIVTERRFLEEHSSAVRTALRAIVLEQGPEVLSQSATMSNLLKDLLPDAPRISKILVGGAEEHIADVLRSHTATGMDIEIARRLAVAAFASATMYTKEICDWVVNEFSIALGLSDDTSGAS